MHVNFRKLLKIEYDFIKTAEVNDNIPNANVSYETNILLVTKKSNSSNLL